MTTIRTLFATLLAAVTLIAFSTVATADPTPTGEPTAEPTVVMVSVAPPVSVDLPSEVPCQDLLNELDAEKQASTMWATYAAQVEQSEREWMVKAQRRAATIQRLRGKLAAAR